MKDKILAIEGLRGWAALMVILSHGALTFFPFLHSGERPEMKTPMEAWIYDSPLAFVYSGTAAVCIFFVLSGYILSRRILVAPDVTRAATAMLVKRYFRLMPPVLVSCLLGYAMFASDFLSVDRDALSGWIQQYGDFDFSLPGAIAQGLWGAFLLSDSSYNWPLWTMKIELYGSLLVFAVCCVLPWLRYPRAFLAVISAALIYSRPESEGLLYALFLLGVALAIDDWTLPTPLAIALVALGIYASAFNEGNHLHAFLARLHPSLDGVELSREYLFNAVGGASLAIAVLHHPRCNRWFSDPWLVKLGELSFGAYLIHMLVLSCFGPWVFDLLLPHTGYVVAGMVGLVFSVVLIYLLAQPYARYLDQTSVRLSNYVAKRLMRTPG